MEPARKNGPMALSTRATGPKTKQTDKENWSMPTAMFMKASGLTTKLTAKALTLTQTALTIMAIGSMTNNTVMEWKAGPMEPSMKATTLMERRKEKVS